VLSQAFVRIKHEPPYTEADEKAVYLNPVARATYDQAKETWMFKPGTAGQAQQARTPAETQMAEALQQSMQVWCLLTRHGLLHLLDWLWGYHGVSRRHVLWMHCKMQLGLDLIVLLSLSSQASSASQDGGFGVDVELVANVNVDNPTFVERNFTTAEIEYCKSQPDAHASFAGRWAAKEAVIKAVSSYNLARDAGLKGAGAGLKDIEILPSASKAPSVTLHGEAKSLVQKAGIKEIKVSISHSGDYAVATAHAC
jgi:fatty acid synthase subunit beta